MNLRAWATLLQYLLYFFVIMKFISGIVIMSMSQTCKARLDNIEMIPKNIPQDMIKIYFIVTDTFFGIIETYGFLVILLSIMGFLGALYLYRWKLINFAFGILVLVSLASDIIFVWAMTNLLKSLNDIIANQMTALFNGSNAKFNPQTQEFDAEKSSVSPKVRQQVEPKSTPKTVTSSIIKGWDVSSSGNARDHIYIDIMQSSLECCGLYGREFWAMKIPTSCCALRYSGKYCNLDVAYAKGCLHIFENAMRCISTLRDESICFFILSFITMAISLHLSYLRKKYPDGVYKTPESSDNEGTDEEF